MKMLVLILFVSMSFIAGTFAQNNFENNPKVKEMRKKFYQSELQFTDSEAKTFWPLFEKFQKEQKVLRKKYNAGAKIEFMSDEEAEAHIQKMFTHDQEKATIKKKYFAQFSKIIPVRKVAKIEATERKFKREVLKRVRQNRKRRN